MKYCKNLTFIMVDKSEVFCGAGYGGLNLFWFKSTRR